MNTPLAKPLLLNLDPTLEALSIVGWSMNTIKFMIEINTVLYMTPRCTFGKHPQVM
jgi:hypothetical protein